MRTFKAAFAYFLAVFAVGFVSGMIRVPFLVPRLGARLSEILELPVMLVASFFLARFVLRRFGPFSAPRRLAIGVVALVLLVATELAVVLIVLGQSLPQYVAGRDPVSGIAYLLSLVAFAFMPILAGRGQGPDNSFKPKPLRGAA